MNKKDRVLAAISHQQVDHVPASFSLHFPREIASGEAAVKAHIDFYRETDCDVLKIMNENLVPEIGEMNGPDDWKKIPAYNRHSPFMVRQLDMIKRILDGVGEPVYALATVHGICASAGLGPGPDNRTDRTGTPEYYLSEKQMVDNQHGAAACMMAVSEQLRCA